MSDEMHPAESMPETPMMASDEPTSNDRLWVLLAYIFSPLVPIIILLVGDLKDRPFIKAHNVQALIIGIVEVAVSIFLSWTLILACLPFVIWLVMIYWGIQGYQGKYVNIPVVTDLVNKQGWA